MKKIMFWILALVLGWSLPGYADVYPFEDEYTEAETAAPVSYTEVEEEDVVEAAPDQTVVYQEETLEASSESAASRRRVGQYNQITFKNFGTVMINLAKGVGGVYRDLFTQGLPSYGSDLVNIPAVTLELSKQMVEIERKALFEADAKQREIDAYREKMQKPLTEEEKQTLEQLQAKQN